MKCWSLIILRSCWTIRSGSVRPGRMCSCCGAGTMSDSPADPESLMRSFLTFCIHILYHSTDSADHFELPVTPSDLLSEQVLHYIFRRVTSCSLTSVTIYFIC